MPHQCTGRSQNRLSRHRLGLGHGENSQQPAARQATRPCALRTPGARLEDVIIAISG
jgi:hypothetical protein